ncbi:UPF0104 family protein [Halomonas sp. ZH2S]|uniref:UPF0104 family protein n=1 Tax=Vreelandella zhuhanensis TaxID=2684210 RepID=A0A7X3H3Q2_9GAMM|nr:lysylphosphatidylglycerol synthase domain-containing protein [Halomonas zhuhanensis]MWJ29063.1 UPF0104 family protein [Halomonas zhuhanensis]
MRTPATDKTHTRKPWQYWLKRGVTLFFFILIPVLLFWLLRNVDWPTVVATLRSYSPLTLLAGVGITAASFMVFSSYDLLGKAYTGHKLPAKHVLPLAFVCYAFNLNLGAWVGGVVLRYRLYSQLGLGVGTVTRILSLSLITNWLGYMLLAGTVFSLRLVPFPVNWQIGTMGLQLIGFGLLAAASVYLAACRFSKRRAWKWRHHEIILPTLRLALIQTLLGAVNWSLMAALIYLLLPEDVFYPNILGILLISSIAGAVTHIPAGLGVLEAVFIALLQHQVPTTDILAALIGYRAIYFLLPLAVACIVYLRLERKAKKRQHVDSKAEITNSEDRERAKKNS